MDTKQLQSEIIIYSKYARWIPELGRRETWDEIVTRYLNMMKKKYPTLSTEIDRYGKYIYEKRVLPSMRALQFAGPAIERNNSRLYNCAAFPMRDIKGFGELMFGLLSGSGEGYSVSQKDIDLLPNLKPDTGLPKKYVISDDIEGWASAIIRLMEYWFGYSSRPNFDYSDIRPKGQELITSGGKAPGPEPLRICIRQIDNLIQERWLEGQTRLTSLDVHDICCFIADAVLSGGIRRAAMISLFDYTDDEMMNCKTNDWWLKQPQRARANNTVRINRNLPEEEQRIAFDRIFEAVKQYGEPGIFWTNSDDYLTNPCLPSSCKVLTNQGYLSIEELLFVDDFISIVNHKGTFKATKPFKTGENQPIWKLRTVGGREIEATSNHKVLTLNFSYFKGDITPEEVFKELKDLVMGDFLGVLDDETGKYIVDYVLEVIDTGRKEDVYDVTVLDDSHCFAVEGGIIAHNCGEIALQPYQFCNLCTIDVGTITREEEFYALCHVATFFGTLQAGFTDFHYLRSEWRRTCEAEALLGISQTGICSNKVKSEWLSVGATVCVKTNQRTAYKIGINPAARITTVKPEGTASLVMGTSSGIHPWYSEYYIRRARFNKEDEAWKQLYDEMPELCEQSLEKEFEGIFCMPIKAPDGAWVANKTTALEQLELVRTYHREWIKYGHISGENSHNVSVTVYVRDNEWDIVKDWMWQNRLSYTAISLLAYNDDDSMYQQPPLQKIDKEEYERLLKFVRPISFSSLASGVDTIELNEELACAGGACEWRPNGK